MARLRRQPDGLWSWFVCFASFVALVINIGSYHSFGLLMPSLMKQFQKSSAIVAWSGSLYISLSYMMGPLVTHFCERFDFRVTAISGSLLVAISFTACSFASDFWLFFAMFSIPAGFGTCASSNCSVLVVLKYFVKWRSLAVGITASSSSAGMFAMTQITQVLLTKYGWSGVMRGWAVLFVLVAFCACTYDPSIRVQEETEENANQYPSNSNYLTLFRNGIFVVYLSSASLVFFSIYVSTVFLVKFSETELGIADDRVTMVYTYMAIAFFFSNHLFCKLSESRFNVFHLYQFSMTVYGIGLLFLPFAKTFAALVVFYVVFGLMDGGRYGLMSLLVLECVGEHQTDRAWGVLTFCVGLTSAFGPTLLGLIADATGSYRPAFWFAGTVMVVGSSLMLLTRCFVNRKCDKMSQLTFTTECIAVLERETVV